MALTIYDNQGRPKRAVRGPDTPMDIWHVVGAAGEPAFLNGWSNYDAIRTLRFRKYPDGRVRITGTAKGGTAAATMFILPVGYRPNAPGTAKVFAASVNDVYGQVLVWGTGDVQAGAGTSFAHVEVEFDTETVLALPGGPMGPIATPPRVTSLPTAPYDGQEIYYVADATNGVLWHLKYNAASASVYKWEFVGGSSLFKQDASSVSVTTLSAANCAITIPLAGDYHFGWGHRGYSSGSDAAISIMLYLYVNNSSVQTIDSYAGAVGNIALYATHSHMKLTGTVAAAGQQADIRYSRTGTNAGTSDRRWLEVRPVRVG